MQAANGKISSRNVLGAVFALLLAVVGNCAFFQSTASAKDPAAGPIISIDINGPINPATQEYLANALEAAERQNATLFVLILNTPGGLLESTKGMVESLLNAKVPTAVLVAPSGAGAISAGTFITLAGHFAYMAPGTNIGAAHPVSAGGGNIQGDMRMKLENYAASLVKSIAERRGRNVDWAEKAVRESVAITAKEAVQENVIDGMAGSLDTLLGELEGKVATVDGQPISLHGLARTEREHITMGLRLGMLNFLCNPNIALLFGLGATLGFLIEIYAPGTFIAGTIGLICLILSLIAGQTLPISSGGAALLVLAGLLFVVELFVPSFGFWGVAGIICLVLGSIYFVDTSMVWSATGFSVSTLLLSVIIFPFVLILFFMIYSMLTSEKRTLRRFRDRVMGNCGEVVSFFQGVEGRDLSYGKIRIYGKRFRANFRGLDPGETLEEGDIIRVVEVDEKALTMVCEPDRG